MAVGVLTLIAGVAVGQAGQRLDRPARGRRPRHRGALTGRATPRARSAPGPCCLVA